MKKKQHALNLESIKSKIRKEHKGFIDKVGDIPLMLDSEDSIKLARVSTKIVALMHCLRDEKVIDLFESNQTSSMYVSYTMIKNGYNSRVVIATDGAKIFLKTLDFYIEFGYNSPFFKLFDIKDVDEFDWDQFSMEILAFIHNIIYRRTDSMTTKFFNS